MATIRFVLGIFCLAVFGQPDQSAGHFLTERWGRHTGWQAGRWAAAPAGQEAALRLRLLQVAQSQVGVREATGRNDGPAVEAYLRYTGNHKGQPWCAAFVSWVYGRAGQPQPRTAWSPALFPLARQRVQPQPADVFGLYFPKLGRIAHAGLVRKKMGSWIYTIEGNTDGTGGRDGQGVYRKLRHNRTIALYANWIAPLQKGGGR